MKPGIRALNTKYRYNAIAHQLGREIITDDQWAPQYSSFEAEFCSETGRQLWINEHAIDICDTESGEIIETVLAPFDDKTIAEQIVSINH